MEGEILPFDMGYLPELYGKKAEVELGESPEKIRKGLRELRNFVNSDKNTDVVTFDDEFLLMYLRYCKFNTNKAISSLKYGMDFFIKNVKVFKGFDLEKVSIATKKKIFTLLPYRCPDGCAILYIKFDNWIPHEFPIEHFRRMIVLICFQALIDPMTQVNGIKIILDASISARILRHASPYNMYLLYYGTQVCAPGRFKAIHIINNSVTFKCGWSIVQHFLSAKIKKRMHFHDNPEMLLKFFPAEVLPKEYGGKLEDYDMTSSLRKAMSPERLASLECGHFSGKLPS